MTGGPRARISIVLVGDDGHRVDLKMARGSGSSGLSEEAVRRAYDLVNFITFDPAAYDRTNKKPAKPTGKKK